MSTDSEVDVSHGDTSSDTFDLSELTETGRVIDAHRTRRRLTKGGLARIVGISRQQLWRVMTGKSALTPALRDRLASALGADELRHDIAASPRRVTDASPIATDREPRASSELLAYLRSPDAIARTLETLPGGSEGRWLHRAVFDVIEEMAAISGVPLDPETLRLRRGLFGDHAASEATALPPRRDASRSA